ncbi:MAG: hypothetical protein KGH69_00775 [Candidatus Micrarchaeota archaeon]|nr:hypothetical protein [Candidatus Micrarchaeota archaeon]
MWKVSLSGISLAELLILLFATVLLSGTFGTIGTLNREFSAITSAFALFTVLAIACHFAFRITKNKRYLLALNASFAMALACIAYYFLQSGAMNLFYLVNLIDYATKYILQFLMLVPLFVFAIIGAHLIGGKKDMKRMYIGIAMLALVLFVLCIYFLSGRIFTGYRIGDENYLSVLSVNATLHGLNPYALSFERQLYSAASSDRILANTITTNNSIIGRFDYPALFFLVQAPFYIVSGFGIGSVSGIGSLLQAAVFMFIAIVCIVFSIDRKGLLKPKYTLIIFAVLGLFSINSFVNLLMIALMVIAYRNIDSRHVWLALGLAASIQEEMWLPCLLMIAYVFNNHGAKRGIYALAGTIAVFFAINAYFILQGPAVFFGNVFLPASSSILPNGPAFFSSFLLTNYGMLLGSFPQITAIVALLLLVLFLYFNRKEMIFLFSVIPWMFFGHALAAYYAMFFFLFVASLHISTKERQGRLATVMRKSVMARYVTAGAFSALLVSVLLVAYSSHAAYVSGFQMSITNQSLSHQGNMSVYDADIGYWHLSNNTMHLVIYGYGNYTDGQYGFYNQSMIPESAQCTSHRCLVNPNIILLNGSDSSYHIRAVITSNSLTPITYASAELYNGQYVYVAHGVWYH